MYIISLMVDTDSTMAKRGYIWRCVQWMHCICKQSFWPACYERFYGYDNPDSTKRSEQDRRVVGNICPSIVFNDVTSLSKHNKKEFLNNRENKKNFIKILLSTPQEAGAKFLQSVGDADHLIAFTALATANTTGHPVVLVGNDTDLLVILVSEASEDLQLYMQFQRDYQN